MKFSKISLFNVNNIPSCTLINSGEIEKLLVLEQNLSFKETLEKFPVFLYSQEIIRSTEGNKVVLNLYSDDIIYGLGSDNDNDIMSLNRNGKKRTMVTGQKINKGHVTADFPIPFAIVKRNDSYFGFYVDTSYKIEFDFTGEEKFYICEDPNLNFYYFRDNNPKSLIESYNRLVGFPSLLPIWAYGLIQSKCSYKNWDEMDDVYFQMNNNKIPFDSLVFDFDWCEHMHNFKFNSRWEGKSEEKILKYKSLGLKFLFSNSGPMISKLSDNYQDGLENKVFATDGKGNTVSCGHYGGDLLDFTSPNIKKWLEKQMKPLFKFVDGWWLDLTEPEGEPPNTVYYSGTKEKIHNIYTLLNTKIYHQIIMRNNQEKRPFILTRTATPGISKYHQAAWTGDVYSDYDTFKIHVPEALNSGMSGVVSWTCDTGGFISQTYNGENGAHLHLFSNNKLRHSLLFQRWFQFSIFTPLLRNHHVGPSAIYDFGDLILSNLNYYTKLRYELIPYIYTSAEESSRTGLPIIRAMNLEHPFEKRFEDISTQYYFGDSILVAPVLEEFESTKKIILPNGSWYDFLDKTQYTGDQEITIFAPQSKIPFLIKENSIIPFLKDDISNLKNGFYNLIEFFVFPKTKGNYSLFLDDGITMNSKQTKINLNFTFDEVLKINVSQNNQFNTINSFYFKIVLNKVPCNIEGYKKVSSLNNFFNFDDSWYYDYFSKELYIKPSNKLLLENLEIIVLFTEENLTIDYGLELVNGKSPKVTDVKFSEHRSFLLPSTKVPGVCLAHYYNKGGQGVAYSSISKKDLSDFRPDENICIIKHIQSETGYYLADFCKYDWINYSIDVEDTNVFEVFFKYRSYVKSTIKFEILGQQNEFTLDLEESEEFINSPKTKIRLNTGEKIFRIKMLSGNIDLIQIFFEVSK